MFHLRLKRRIHIKNTTELAVIRLLMAIGFAGMETVWVLYMSTFGLTDSVIGYITAAMILVALITTFFSTILLEKYNEHKIFFSSIISYILALSIIFMSNSLTLFILMLILITVSVVLRTNSFGILFRDEANEKELNEDEGLMFALINVGWLVGPLIAGFVMTTYSMKTVFLSSAIFLLIGLFLFSLIDIVQIDRKKKKLDKNIFLNINKFISNKNLRLPYLFAVGVEIWWALIYIYVPLFMIKSGLPLSSVGVFLSVITVPLIILEYQVGRLSEKYGFKMFFLLGYLFLGIFAIFAGISSSILLSLVFLTMASIAMAFIEPLQEAYFFSKVKKNEEEILYPIFGTAPQVGSFVGKIAIASILLILPNSFAYHIIGFFMILIAIAAMKVKI